MDNNNLNLIKRVSEKLETSEENAEKVIRLTIEGIKKILVSGKDLDIPSMGKFEVKSLPGKKVLFFKASQELLNQ